MNYMKRSKAGNRSIRRLGSGLVFTGLATLLGQGCLITETNLGYCSNINGDLFCAQRHDGARPFCVFGSETCLAGLPAEQRGDPGFDGCVEDAPASECYSPCGGGQSQADLGSCVEAFDGSGTDGGATTSDSSSGGSTTSEVSADGTSTETSDGTSTGPASACGNGILEEGEVCDGTDFGGEDCQSQEFDEGTIGCGEDCMLDTSACVLWSCGNNERNDGEVCDGADLGGVDCASLGYDDGELACLAGCMGFDTVNCNFCGNGIVEASEQCDGDVGSATCDGRGYDGGVLACGAGCTFDTSGCYTCDGGTAEVGEICDGADLNGADCTTLGYESGNLGCAPDCSAYDTTECAFYSGNCCTGNFLSPGCENPVCAAAVCANELAEECCEVNWGWSCAAYAGFTAECSCP